MLREQTQNTIVGDSQPTIEHARSEVVDDDLDNMGIMEGETQDVIFSYPRRLGLIRKSDHLIPIYLNL